MQYPTLHNYFENNLKEWCKPFNGEGGASEFGWKLKNYDIDNPPMYLYFAVVPQIDRRSASDSAILYSLKQKVKNKELTNQHGSKSKLLCKIGISKNPFQRLGGLKSDLNNKNICLSNIFEITENKNYKENEDACLKYAEKDIVRGEWMFVDPHSFIHGIMSIFRNYTISNHFEIMSDEVRSPQGKTFFNWLIKQEIKGYKKLKDDRAKSRANDRAKAKEEVRFVKKSSAMAENLYNTMYEVQKKEHQKEIKNLVGVMLKLLPDDQQKFVLGLL